MLNLTISTPVKNYFKGAVNTSPDVSLEIFVVKDEADGWIITLIDSLSAASLEETGDGEFVTLGDVRIFLYPISLSSELDGISIVESGTTFKFTVGESN